MNKMPTETVSLPSKGILYPENAPLSKGMVDMMYMSAVHEDILTNINYLRQGTAIDRLLQSLIVTPIEFDDLLIGDKDAIMLAARILGYGKEYSFKYTNSDGKTVTGTVDLTQIKEKNIDYSLFKKGANEFALKLPTTDNDVTFKLLTHGDEKKINQELKGLERVSPNSSFGVTTRLKHMITSINGNRDKGEIANFVKSMVVNDARALRKEYEKICPGVDMIFYPEDENYTGEGIDIPIDITFFWPDARV